MVRLWVWVSLLLLVGGSHPGLAADKDDFRIWQTGSVAWKMNDQLQAKLGEQIKWTSRAEGFFYRHIDIGLSSNITSQLTLGINFRKIAQQKGRTWLNEDRPHINGIFHWKRAGWDISDRNRLEYRFREEQDNGFRYRNFLIVKLPVKWISIQIRPFVGDEFFIDLREGELNKNRLYTGLGSKLSSVISFELYYILQSNKSPDNNFWTKNHIIGTELKLSF